MSKRPEEQDTFDQVIKAIDDTETAPERHLSIQMDKAVRDAILAARESGQKASITLQLRVQPEVRLRVDVTRDAKVLFTVRIHAAGDVLSRAFESICDRVKADAGVTLFMGTPE